MSTPVVVPVLDCEAQENLSPACYLHHGQLGDGNGKMVHDLHDSGLIASWRDVCPEVCPKQL